MPSRKITEDSLIRVIQRTVKSRGRVRLGIGDDAAVLKDGTVVTTDAYAESVHFDLSYMTLRQVGERCACGAISDVVAMAAEPEAVFVSLALPHRALCPLTPARRRARVLNVEGQVRQLYSGIDGVCADMGCDVAGGDIIVADRLLLALTVTGKTRAPKFRTGGRPGDSLYLTGYLGSAEAGRMLLAEKARSQESERGMQNSRDVPSALGSKMSALPHWARPLVRRHVRPLPRLGAMRVLRSSISGLIDTSDGLATDARHLSEMSGVKIVLDGNTLPILPATKRFCAGRGLDPVSFVLGAGEDYELLFTSSHRIPDEVRGVNVARIGNIERGHGLWIRYAGKTISVTATGYDHLSRGVTGTTC